jgi:nitroreductase
VAALILLNAAAAATELSWLKAPPGPGARLVCGKEAPMQLIDALYGRRAVRDYAPRAVDRQVLRNCIAAAVEAPSAMNLQPWSFAVVVGRDKLAGLSQRAKAHVLKVLTPDSPLARYRAELADPGFDIFYNAPVAIVVCATSIETAAAEDCCLAAQNLMLAAYGYGLGTCWIGFSRPWLNTAEGKRALAIPEHYAPVAPIIVGYPAEVPSPVPRHEPDIIWIES